MHLLSRDDVPRRDQLLPRALLPEQDQLLQQELRRRDDLPSNLLLLQRRTGMRVDECVDLVVSARSGRINGPFTCEGAARFVVRGNSYLPLS